MRTTLLSILVLLVPAIANAEHGQRGRSPVPIQMTLAAGVNYHEDGRPETPGGVGFGALWIGGSLPLQPWNRTRTGLFVGPGVEGTLDGINGPYEWSAGGGMRFGYAWYGHLRAPVPDGYVYMRVTPFFGLRSIADEEYLGDNPVITRSGQGVRLGAGFTSPAWSAFVLGGMADGPGNMHFHDPYEMAFCCILGIAAVLVNHGELTWEIYSEPGRPVINRVGFRIGTGF